MACKYLRQDYLIYGFCKETTLQSLPTDVIETCKLFSFSMAGYFTWKINKDEYENKSTKIASNSFMEQTDKLRLRCYINIEQNQNAQFFIKPVKWGTGSEPTTEESKVRTKKAEELMLLMGAPGQVDVAITALQKCNDNLELAAIWMLDNFNFLQPLITFIKLYYEIYIVETGFIEKNGIAVKNDLDKWDTRTISLPIMDAFDIYDTLNVVCYTKCDIHDSNLFFLLPSVSEKITYVWKYISTLDTATKNGFYSNNFGTNEQNIEWCLLCGMCGNTDELIFGVKLLKLPYEIHHITVEIEMKIYLCENELEQSIINYKTDECLSLHFPQYVKHVDTVNDDGLEWQCPLCSHTNDINDTKCVICNYLNGTVYTYYKTSTTLIPRNSKRITPFKGNYVQVPNTLYYERVNSLNDVEEIHVSIVIKSIIKDQMKQMF